MLMTIREVAERLRIHPITAYRWAESGFLPSIKLGSRRLIRSEDLERWIGQRSAA